MDSWGDRMPLPDANKTSPRVYTNLQNLDLSTVTFSNIETTGDPIAIEEANEDELRRLVLVNLARLVCAGEWTGLLEAGGTPTMNGVLADAALVHADYAINRIDATPPWGQTTGNNGTVSRNEPQWAPFVSPASGDVASISIDINSVASSAVNFNLALYSDDDGLPNAKLTEGVFDAEVDGLTTQTSLTGTATLVKGTQYWYAWVRDDDVSFTITGGDTAPPYMGPTAALTNSWQELWIPSGSDNTLPATVTATDLQPRGYTRPSVGIEFS